MTNVLEALSLQKISMCSGSSLLVRLNLAGIYLLKVNNRDTGTRRETCSKLIIKTLERRQWRRFGVFIVNFEEANASWEIYDTIQLI